MFIRKTNKDTVTVLRTMLDNDDRTVALNMTGEIHYLGDKFIFTPTDVLSDETMVRFVPSKETVGLEATYRFKSPTMKDVKNGSFGARVARVLPEVIVHRMLEQYYETESVWH